jgi:gamma-glutamyl:cysteine ligase YbdK (ATP-grasp superfamily)
MGQDIQRSQFSPQDFLRFEQALTAEMVVLHEHFLAGRFSSEAPRIGLELEAWLIDHSGEPQPRNAEFLAHLNSEMVVPELSQFNVEFNVPPQELRGSGIHEMGETLAQHWQMAMQAASEIGLQLVMIGILPTVREQHLSLSTISQSSRYRALNEQVLRLRGGRPIQLLIHGEEELFVQHADVMLEAAATSLQVHYQVPLDLSVRYFNAALLASAVAVGLAANSPWLFGKRLWAETRIPLFERAVDLGGPIPRVHFGSGYARDSFEEFFQENRDSHPVLLPIPLDESPERFPHTRLHNGTIWRWNRPLIGFSEGGLPHVRVEHRVMPAGPTLGDMLANITFVTGLIHHLATREIAPESQIPFEIARQNFHQAAQHGLKARLGWCDGSTYSLTQLVEELLLEHSQSGLQSLSIDSEKITSALNLVADRVQSGQNGARWQTRLVDRYGRDMPGLTRAYLDRQRSGEPVHLWTL